MKMFRKTVIAFCGLSALSLAACGDGWEMVETRGSVPYTEERTAGPGVAYVRAHMMPEKSVVLQPAAPVVPAPEAPKSAEPIFQQKIQKK